MNGAKITPVILCGGAGSRLWPLSTPERPKPFLALAGDRSMLQLTALRTMDRERFAPPVVIAAEAHQALVEEQLAAIALPSSRLILEPCPRGTAPAVALAALEASPDDLLLVMPSDHLIAAPERLLAAVEQARPLVGQGWLAIFGVRADRPETGYGYVRRGEQIAPGVSRGQGFVEKPDADKAALLIARGDCDWNAGIFLFAAGTYLDALRAHAPDIAEAAEAAHRDATREGSALRPGAEAFARSRAESVDRAVLEKHGRIAVAPVDMGWSDIGSWDALFEASGAAAGENVLAGPVAALAARGLLIRSDGPRVVAIGVEDLIVVAAGDSVLVVRRGQSQRLREALDAAGPAASPDSR